MIWLNPWAWLGAVGVALPVLLHLLARGHARVHRFPTLRFLDASRLLPTRRTRVHDAVLLGVRCGAIVLAAAALARPLILTAGRKRSLDRGLARAIVVDTSASMRRRTPTGETAVDSARKAARTLAAAARVSITIESSDPARALQGASAWLAAQGRRAELIVLSDFQRGQIDSTDVSSVPNGVGVALHRVPITNTATVETQAIANGVRVAARTKIVGDRIDAEWSPAGTAPPNDDVALLGSDTDRAALGATRDAAATIATPLPLDSARAVAIVFPNYPGRAQLEASIRRNDVARGNDANLAAKTLASRFPPSASHITAAGVATIGGRERLALFTNAEPGSLASAQLIAAANRATSLAPPARELEPETLSDAALAALERPSSNDVPSQLHPTGDDDTSDGRWLWIGVLALLLLELPLRSPRDKGRPETAEERARAA